MYEKFMAMTQGKTDYSTEVFAVGGRKSGYGMMMCIAAEEGAIYITKEQAKEFFGLEEKL